MKNFFKKLSFVMALAMVLTALAPAVAGADASYIYKRGNDTQKEALEVYFGDADEKRDLNVKINGKKTNDGTWKIGNKAIATIDENGVVTPVKNGTTTAKFTAEDGTAVKVKVVVGTRAAGVKVKDNGVAITELTLVAGEEKELKFGAYISGKAKNAGATKASQEVAMTAEGEAVTTTVDGKYVTVKAEKAGEATLTFTAGKKTATVAVTVVNGLAATQTGANKITVTGSDLSDKVADYAVKRGTNTVALASVALNEEKTEAVITTSAKNPVAGKYTVSFQGSDAVEFEMATSKVTKIVFGSETAIMKTNKTAEVTFVVLNQFDENVTASAYANLAITTSCDGVEGTAKTLVAAANTGVITFGKATNFMPTVDVVVATVVDKTNGVNANGTFTVSQIAQPATVEVLGLYKKNATTLAWEAAELKEGTVNADTYYLAVAVKDQYGTNVPAANLNSTNFNVNVIAGLTQVAVTNAAIDMTNAYGANFAVGYPVNAGTVKAGTVSVLAVVLTSGNTASASINVAPTTKVASIELAATDALYVGKEAEIAYTALDAEGNEVTKYDLLTNVVVTGAGISYRWAKQPDGSAKLYMTLSAKNVVVITTTPTMQYKTTTFTAFDACVPTAITGVNAKAVLGAISGSAIQVPVSFLNVEDQYGNAMSATAVADAINGGNYKIKVAYGTSDAIDGSDVIITSIVDNTLVVDATTDGKGVEQVTISLMNKDYTGAWVDTLGSDATITLKAVELAQCTTFEVAPVGLKQSFGTATDAAIKVYGFADGTKVELTAAEYDVVVGAGTADGKIEIPAKLSVSGKTEYSKEYVVVIANKAGTELKFTVEYSEKDAAAASATVNAAVTQRLVNGTTYNVQDILGFFTIKDQYGNTLSAASQAANTRISVSGYTPFAAISGNGTPSMTYADRDTVAHFVITIGTFSFEADIVVY